MSTELSHAETKLQSSPDTHGRDLALAAFRIALGLYWLYEQHWKLPPRFGIDQPRGLMFAFQQSIEHPTLGLYRTFLQELIVPNFFLVGWLIFFSEVTIGTSLTLGLFKKAGALMGVGQAANLLVSQASTPEGPWIYIAILAASLFVLFTPCNRRLSIDSYLAPKLAERASKGSFLARILLWMM